MGLFQIFIAIITLPIEIWGGNHKKILTFFEGLSKIRSVKKITKSEKISTFSINEGSEIHYINNIEKIEKELEKGGIVFSDTNLSKK